MSDLNHENKDETAAVVNDTVIENTVVEPKLDSVETSKVDEPVVEVPVIESAVLEEPKIDPIKVEPKTTSKNVVLYSLKDIKIDGLGSLKKGYNSVPFNKMDKWLEKNAVRLATEQEIKTYLN